MCGIALIAGRQPSRITFQRMLETLRRRGEVEEVVRANGLLAGTHRLRIVDPAGGGQPLMSSDGRWLLCYNGEIFNYRSLRDQLGKLGHEFRTNCDTEVVLEALRRWGETAVRLLRGEYALVLADRADGRIYLARDPVGVKPLDWSSTRGCRDLAAAIKALVPVGRPI